MSSNMTPAQEEALKKIDDLAREHFDGFVSIFEVDDVAGDGETRADYNRLLFNGGFSRAIGLCVIAIEEIKNDERREREEL